MDEADADEAPPGINPPIPFTPKNDIDPRLTETEKSATISNSFGEYLFFRTQREELNDC